MTTSVTPSSTSPVESLEDLETLLAMMKSFGVAICELPGLKLVMAPEHAQPVRQEKSDAPMPKTIHDDPFSYSDGVVPDFRTF